MMEKKYPDNDKLQVTLQLKGKMSFAFIRKRRCLEVRTTYQAMNWRETKNIKPIEREGQLKNTTTAAKFKPSIQIFFFISFVKEGKK